MSLVASAAPENTGTDPDTSRPKVLPLKDQHDGAITTLFETYYPEGLDEFEALQAEHRAFHEGQSAIREAHKATIDAMKEDIKSEMIAIRTALEAGEITEEDAASQRAEIRSGIEEHRAEMLITKTAIDEILSNKQSEVDAIKALNVENRAVIQAALASDPIDTAAIISGLQTVTDLLEEHIAVDYDYAEQVSAVIE